MKKRYYNIFSTIEKYPNAKYYVIYGERSNGKTYSSLDYVLSRFFKYGEEFAYVRRFGEDIKRKNLLNLFSALLENGALRRYRKDDIYKSISYSGNSFYLDGETKEESVKIGNAFDLNSMEHYKSISFPKVTTIIFDEFVSRQGYIPNEFVLFMNTISTIVRDRNNVKIIMLGNTVNKYCPYFQEMGLSHIKEQKPGTIDLYKYGESDLEVICEYCESSKKFGGKLSDVYFAFDNPHLEMITKGAWEIGIYPRLNKRYLPKDVITNFFVIFDGSTIHCEAVVTDSDYFIFAHPKTTPIKDEENDIVYTDYPDERYNYRMGLKYRDKLTQFILRIISENRMFYSSNEVGEVFRNYIKWASKVKSVEGDI